MFDWLTAPVKRYAQDQISNNILLRSTTELIRRAKLEISVRPTAALTDREAKSLFQFISRFRERGGAIFYISHRLDEILEYGDRISVLRDGAYITELDPRRTNKDEMVGHMAGRKFIKSNLRAGARQGSPSEIVLKVQDLARKREFDGVSFELRRGEILGVSAKYEYESQRKCQIGSFRKSKVAHAHCGKQ